MHFSSSSDLNNDNESAYSVYNWGYGEDGILLQPFSSDIKRKNQHFPKRISDFDPKFDISTYQMYSYLRITTCFLLDHFGRIYSWGDNSSGQLGLGHKNPVKAPTLMANVAHERVVQIVVNHFLTSTGNVFGYVCLKSILVLIFLKLGL